MESSATESTKQIPDQTAKLSILLKAPSVYGTKWPKITKKFALITPLQLKYKYELRPDYNWQAPEATLQRYAHLIGLKTAIVEREALGGICLNWGCIPTKALLKSAKVFEYLQHADYGITVKGLKLIFRQL